MSTANNRLEIVGLGKKSVTFRFIQTDRTYDPVAQTGAKGIVGRASTRSEETDFSRLEHFVVEMNDPESNGTTITRIIRPKENKRRDGQENSSVLKGEFAPADHNVWTDLSSSASPSEANALNADYASPAVINNYPNIIATKYGTYNPGDSTTAAANSSGNGSELFGNGKAHGDSGLVRFLSGLNMTAGFHGEANVTPYVLKDEGSGAGTIMFRIVAGEERHDDDEGVIEPNKHYHIVSVEAHFLNKKEVFSNDEKQAEDGAAPIETAIEIDHKFAVERRIAAVLNAVDDVTIDDVQTTFGAVRTACGINTKAAWDALDLYDRPDLSENIMFLSLDNVALTGQDVDSGKKRKSGSSTYEDNQTEITLDIIGLPEEVAILNYAGKDVAMKTYLKLELQAQLLSRNGTQVMMEPLADPTNPEDRMIDKFYLTADSKKLVITPSLANRQTGDLDIKLSINIEQDYTSFSSAATGMNLRQTLAGTPYLLANVRGAGDGAIVLSKMNGYQELKASGGTAPAANTVVDKILKFAAPASGSATQVLGLPNVLYADDSTASECIFGAKTLSAAYSGVSVVALGAVSHGKGNTSTVAATSEDWTANAVKDLELAALSASSSVRRRSGIRQRRITRSGGLKAENIEANWKHAAPNIQLTDKGETTKLKSGSTTDYETVRAYRRARNSDGFYISVENADTSAVVEKASHCLVLYKEQSRSEYEGMFDKDGKLKEKADNLLTSTKWKTVKTNNNDRALAATTDDTTWYVEKELLVSKDDHGKCFTILACWGRPHESKAGTIVWGDLGELGRISDAQKSPNSDAGEYFTGDIGPQLYINEETLAAGFSVKLSNRVTTSGNSVYNEGYFHVEGAMDKAFSNLDTGLVKDAVDSLIGLTTKRPVAADAAKGIEKFDAEVNDPIGVYTNAVRAYARDCGASTAVVDATRYVDPTQNKGLTTSSTSVADLQKDLTVFQKQAKSTTLAKTDFARIQNFGYVAVSGLASVFTAANMSDTGDLMDAASGVYVMGMLYRLRKCQQIIANNPVAKNASGDVIPKPQLDLNVDGIQNQIAKRFASGQQVGGLRMILEVTDGALASSGSYSTDSLSAKALKDLTVKILSSATMDISTYVKSTIDDGDKFMQLTAARIALDGRGNGINAKSSAGGDYETVAKGSKRSSTKLGAAGDAATSAASIFFDVDHKVTRDDASGGKRVCRPSLKQPFLRTTVLQNGSSHLYGTMRATKYESPGVTLSTGSGRNDAVLEIGLNLLNVATGKLGALSGGFSSPPTESERMQHVMSNDQYDIHHRFSTKLVASFDQHNSSAPVALAIRDQKLVEREYADAAVVTDSGRQTQTQLKKSSGGNAAGYQLIGLISANFDKAYQQNGDSTDLDARLRIGLQQTVMGPIQLSKDPVYGVPTAGSSVLDLLPESIALDDTMISRATDTDDKELDLFVTNNSGVQIINGTVNGAEFGAVGYMGEYEVNNRKRDFGPWFLAQAELGEISVTQGAAGTDDHGKVLLEVEESIANKTIKKDSSFVDTNAMDIDDDDMFEVKVRVRAFADPGELSTNTWSNWATMTQPTHAGPTVKPEDETTVYTLADQVFKSGGTSIGGTNLTANKRWEFQFQQFAKVASAVKTIAKEGGATAALDSSVFSSSEIAIGNAKTISIVYTRMSELISGSDWVVDKKRETNPDMLNSITADNGTDQHDFIRIEPNDLVSLASNPFVPPDDTLIVNKSKGSATDVEDHEISAWAAQAYSNFNVKLVVEATIAASRSAANSVTKEKKVVLGEVTDLRLVPKVARDVQAMPEISNHVVRDVTTRQALGSLYRPVEYNNSTVSADRVADSWLLVNKKDGTLWRQAMFEGLFAKMEAALVGEDEEELAITGRRLLIRPVGSALSYTGSDDIRMLMNTQDDNNVLVANANMPTLRNKLDPLQGFAELPAPTIIDSDNTAASSNKRLEIPITLSADGLEQVNIMIAHSTDNEAYFNDLRADGPFVREFKKRNPATSTAGASIASSATAGGATTAALEDSIQLAASPAAVSAANGGSSAVALADLVTDTVSGTTTAKDLFFFQKINNGQRVTANVDFQISGGSSSTYQKNLSGRYILHAAIPAEGDNQFLLLNVVTNGGNRKFIAYKKAEALDENGNQKFERVNKHHHD